MRWRLLLPGALTAVTAAGCRAEPRQTRNLSDLAVTRYNVNILEQRDLVNVYAEVVNRGRHRAGPAALEALIQRPSQRASGEYQGRGLAKVPELRPGETVQVSVHMSASGRIRPDDLRLSLQPIQVLTELRPPPAFTPPRARSHPAFGAGGRRQSPPTEARTLGPGLGVTAVGSLNRR